MSDPPTFDDACWADRPFDSSLAARAARDLFGRAHRLQGDVGELDRGAVLGGIFPARAGNVLGGAGIFAALTYAQVREEI